MYKKKCVICGDEFETNIKKVKVCSKKHIKTCELCGKDFEMKKSSQKYCSMPHKMKCFNCGKDFEIKRAYKGRTDYSCGDKVCKQALIEHTNQKKYGVNNVFQSSEIKEKIKETNLKNYGVEYLGQSKEIMSKVHNTMIKKYGAKTAIQSKKLKEKIHKTNIERYGFENVAKSPIIQERIKKTNQMKYGVNSSFQAECVKQKIKETNINKYSTTCPRWYYDDSRNKAESTNLIRYGHINPFGGEEIKEKIKKKNLEKYGVPWTTQSEEIKRKMNDSRYRKHGVYNYSHINVKNYTDFLNMENFLINTDLSVIDIAKYFNVGIGTIRKKVKEYKLEDRFQGFYKYSIPEQNFISKLAKDPILKNEQYISNDRKILNGRELDFYFPNLKLAIEISPTFTHNSKFDWANEGEGLPIDYHKKKFDSCDEKDINLITVFDWHDLNSIINMIKYEYFDMNYEDIIKTITNKYKGVDKKEIIIQTDCSLGSKNFYKKIGFEIVDELNPKLNYFNVKLNIHLDDLIEDKIDYSKLSPSNSKELKSLKNSVDKSDIETEKLSIEKTGFLPVYDCGYRIWKYKV